MAADYYTSSPTVVFIRIPTTGIAAAVAAAPKTTGLLWPK